LESFSGRSREEVGKISFAIREESRPNEGEASRRRVKGFLSRILMAGDLDKAAESVAPPSK